MTISTSNKYLLNRMNSRAKETQLGTLIENGTPKYKGLHTTVGGAAAEDIILANVVATDIVLVTLHTEGSSAVTVKKAVGATGKITVTFSGNPSSDHVISYVVFAA